MLILNVELLRHSRNVEFLNVELSIQNSKMINSKCATRIIQNSKFKTPKS